MKLLQIDGLHPNVSNLCNSFQFQATLIGDFLMCLDLIEAVGPYPNQGGRCQAKFLTSAKFLIYYCLSVILFW